MKKENCIAIIPARIGSKRIKNKNIKDFCGKPIIAYSIQAAIKSKLFDRVIVSTDSKKIAKVAKKYGAEIPFLRSKKLSNDFTDTQNVIEHAIKSIRKKNNNTLKAVCCIYATAPFLKKKDLINGLRIFKSGKWIAVFSATTYSFPVFRSFTKNKNSGLKMFFPDNFKKRSQDFKAVFHDAGQFCWAKPIDWINKKIAFNNRSTIVELPNWRVQDIDTLGDWKRAELKFKTLKNK